MTLRYSVDAAAPVVILPRRTDSDEAAEMDLSRLRIDNELEWRWGSSHRDPGAALIDTIRWELDGVALRVLDKAGNAGGGGNVLVPPPSGAATPAAAAAAAAAASSAASSAQTDITLVMRHPKWDQSRRVTSLEVDVSSPTLHVEVDEDEYRVLCAVIGENFSEEGEPPGRLFHSPEIVAPPPMAAPERHGAAPTLPPSWLRISVHLPDMRLALFHSPRCSRVKPLASLRVENLWAAYRTAG